MATEPDLGALTKRLMDAANDPTYSGPRVRRADIFEIVRLVDAQAARLAALQQALQWAVTTLDGYGQEATAHWMAGWADWLDQQARPALEGSGDG